MNPEIKHIIEKVFLEISVLNEKEAHRIKKNAGLYAQEKLFPVLEEVFDEFDKGTDILRFDRLDIDFALQNWNDERTLKKELIESLRTQFNATNKEEKLELETEEIFYQIEGGEQIVDTQQNYRATFLYFIENGYLPWYGKPEYISELVSDEKWKKNLSNDNFLSDLKRILETKTTAIERFIFQFSDEVILQLIRALNVLKIRDVSQLMRFVNRSGNKFRDTFLKGLVMLSLQALDKKKFLCEIVIEQVTRRKYTELNAHKIYEEIEKFNIEVNQYFTKETVSQFFSYTPDEINKVSKELLLQYTDVGSGKGSNESADSVPNIKPTVQNIESVSDEKKSPFFDKDNQDILVMNAGLVILGLFLPTFLKQFGWITNSGAIKKDTIYKAVQSVHFLVSGQTKFFEGNLIFEKFLCGVPLQTSIPERSLLEDEVLKESENLLRQVIKNWPALKNTSPDGLRELFVKRSGKLIQKDGNFKLIVERKTQDILLEKLQWNISIIKLPWKKELIFVEW